MPNAGLSPISLTLSDDSAIESILSDIPLFCVGLMSFGVFTFVLILKRVNLIAVHLYASAFIAFAAGIFDLGHVLAQGRASPANGPGADTASGLITAREVTLALSLGFNFIFLWHLVAQCPRDERHAPPIDVKSNLGPTAYVHSASWKRWGVVGLLLQWGLLCLSFSIPILQIVWRISPPNVRFGTAYIAEATTEVVVSALFILKIFLNIFLSPLTPWWRPLQSNIAPLFALSISTGLGLGNLVALAFSETTLGRFLRAVELYILILFVLVTAFYKVASHPSSLQNDPGKSFIRISEKPQAPALRTDPPIPPLIASLGIVPRRSSIAPGNNELRRPSVATSLSRLSSWVLALNTVRRNSAERIHTEDRELGMAPAEDAMARVDSPRPTKSEEPQKPPILDTNLASDDVKPEEQSTTSKDRPWTALSIPSYYRLTSDHQPPPPGILTRDTDSPIYGLNGIIARVGDREKQSRPQSSVSFEELLRQQTELDKSIAALRLFSEATSPPDTETSQRTIPVPLKAVGSPKTRSTSASTNSYLGRKADSASNRSDFSLSIFPEPPAASTNELTPAAKLERLAGRARALRRDPVADDATDVVASNVIEEQSPSLPVSPTRYEGTPRLESAGTQYDVTSFIGGLSVPISGSVPNTGSAVVTGGTRLSDVESEDEPSPETRPITAATTQSIRPMILASSAILTTPATADVVPTTSIERPREVGPLKREPNVPLRPFLLGTSSQAMPIILPSSTMVPIGPRRKGLPSNPRLPTISWPSLPLDDGRGDQAPGAFERPRPPPLLLPK